MALERLPVGLRVTKAVVAGGTQSPGGGKYKKWGLFLSCSVC